MSEYITILIWSVAVMYFLPRLIKKQPEEVFGHIEYRYSYVVALLAILPLIWIAGNRGNFNDTELYVNSFLNSPSSLKEIPAYARSLKKDPGFYTCTAILHVIIGDHRVRYLMVIAAIQAVSVTLFYRKYSTDYGMSFFLFIVSTDYISWMFNGIRQFTAVIIILLATPFIVRRKYVPTILLIVIASTMHQSALIMIPIIIIATGEAWNKKTILFILLILLSVAYIGQFTNLLDDALQNTQYASVVSDYKAWKDNGTNPLRVLIYSIPAIISFWGRRTILQEDNVLINVCVNMSIITAGLYIIAMVTSGIFIGRLPIYASMFLYILLPWEIEHLFSYANSRILHVFLIAGYLAYYYAQMHLIWGLI